MRVLSLCLLTLLTPHGAHGFILPTPRAATAASLTTLASSAEPNESDDDRKRRMELVRSLQSSYYKSPSSASSVDNSNAPALDKSTGIVSNLPLWRVPWTELPGRANVLNVHDPMYTNMFETILNQPGGGGSNEQQPWYFGHLYIPGGAKNLHSGKYEFELKSWKDDAANVNRSKVRTSVVGTLMKIVDFRRLEDGRLCLLVHAMERFVVTDAIQNLPYSIANVQIVPDFYDAGGEEFSTSEEQTVDRADRVVTSFQYHDYEYCATPLPLPDQGDKYMSQSEVYGSWLNDVLPFVSYNLDDAVLPAISNDKTRPSTEASLSAAEPSLETRLVENWILKDPLSHPFVELPRAGMSNDDLENYLWNAMEDFCNAKGVQISSEVLCLLPPGRSWLPDNDIDGGVSRRRVSPDYPKERRQTRLSFAAAAIVEMTELGTDMRQVWLETPSTNARLADLLERFDVMNDHVVGEFQ